MTKNTNIYIYKIELKYTHIYPHIYTHIHTPPPPAKMVRNEGGGNKMKHLARKHVNGSSHQANKFLRVSQCKEEVYAYIMRLLGNSMCMVKCVDGYERLCHIRGKFTGRSKRENALSQGTWVLIGLREWDMEKEFASKVSKTEKKLQKCDLLEIYSSAEREKLRVQEKIFQDGSNSGDDSDSDNDHEFKSNSVEFKDSKTLEYQEIVEQGGKLSQMKITSYESLYDGISDSESDSESDNDKVGDSDNRAAPAKSAPATSAAPVKQHHQPVEEIDIDDI